MGCLYRRGKKYWIKYYRNGKAIMESTHSEKKEVASRLLKQREGEISKGEIPGIYFEKVSFEELVDAFLADYRINAKKTLDNAEQNAGRLKKFFGGKRATEIDTAKIGEYVESRKKDGVANATINRELAALKRMFHLGFQCTPPKVRQIPYIPMLKERNVGKGFFGHQEFMGLRDALPAYLKPVVTFAYHTGWRKEEILGLTWDKVNLKAGIIRLDPGETKNEEARTLYLDAELSVLMRDLMASRRLGCPFVFHRNGRRIGEFRKTWKAACIAAGLSKPMGDENGKPVLNRKGNVTLVPTRIFHDFRRTAVRNMVRSGVPERVAMAVSGHKTRSVFDRYNIVSEEDLRQAAMKQESYLQAQNGYNLVTIEELSTGRKAGKKAKVLDFIGADGES